MTRRSAKSVEKRHAERMAWLDRDLGKGQYHTALESARWILGDKTLPPSMRLVVTLKEVRALLGVGRSTEAATRLCAAVNSMHRYRLYVHRAVIDELTSQVECARRPGLVGHVGR
jgi:hypothetical protein